MPLAAERLVGAVQRALFGLIVLGYTYLGEIRVSFFIHAFKTLVLLLQNAVDLIALLFCHLHQLTLKGRRSAVVRRHLCGPTWLLSLCCPLSSLCS